MQNQQLPDVVIVDTGCANITSVYCAIERLGAKVMVSRDAAQIKNASRVIIPGVGTAKQAMDNIQARGLLPVLQNLQQPVLGICLGMQLLSSFSKEGDVACLDRIPGTVEILAANGLRLPHMGWNTLKLHPTADAPNHPLLDGLGAEDYVYFVHSFALPVSRYTLASCHYGSSFSAVIGRNNYLGAQFHPERSSKTGARLLANFLTLSPAKLWASCDEDDTL